MPVYKYVGRTAKGTQKRGTIVAQAERDAVTKLNNEGIKPRSITQSTSILHKEISLGGKVKADEFVAYCRQFATLIRAGISLIEATNILAVQTSSTVLRNALMTVEEEIRSGSSFSEAARHNEKVFPPLFINMIRVGEATGNIDATLERLATYYEKQHRLRKSIQSALMYPAVLLVVIIVVSIGLLVTVVPSFADMFDDFGIELPFITLFILQISALIKTIWWVLLLIAIIIPIVFRALLKNSEPFNFFLSSFALRMPVFGKLLRKSAIAQMTRTLASLLNSSVPILQALFIVERVVNNRIIGKVIADARTSLERGGTLASPFEKSWVFPPLVTQMMSIGEQTGSLDYMLEKVADFYEDDVDRTVETLKSLIEPIMIVILAVVVGTIVLSIMVPMFTLFEQIS